MPTDTLPTEYIEGYGIVEDEYGNAIEQHKMRVMSPLDIKQRLELNQANTASAQRARVLRQNATENGHGSFDRIH
jgi:hypothetical protein